MAQIAQGTLAAGENDKRRAAAILAMVGEGIESGEGTTAILGALQTGIYALTGGRRNAPETLPALREIVCALVGSGSSSGPHP